MNRIAQSVAFLALTLITAVNAQSARPKISQEEAVAAKQQYIVPSQDATVACSFTFTANSGNKFIKYCVTKNGSITQFESPQGREYISLAPAGEGYGLCNFDAQTQYCDYAGYGDSSNWQAPTTL